MPGMGSLPLDQIAAAVLGGADRAVTSRWEPAVRRAAEAEGRTKAEKVEAVTRQIAKELAGAGAAAGGAAAVPGVGTAASLAGSLAEVGFSTVRLADLILTIAAIHGHDRASVEERSMWVLSVLAFGDGASQGLSQVAGDVGRSVGGPVGQKVGAAGAEAINTRLRRKVIKAVAKRRALGALGRAMPFGVGAAFGGATSYLGAKAVAKQADRFFRDHRTGVIDAAATPSQPRIGRG